jgi:Ni/Co efflux regulator RcnB
MKNLVISALVVGALACPVAFAEEMKGANPAPEATTSEADAKPKHHKKAKHKKHKAGKKHKRAHHKIYKEHKHHHHHKAHGETQAEKQIDKETELNNR